MVGNFTPTFERKHTRKYMPFHMNRDSEEGQMKYGLGWHVIMAGLVQNERGTVYVPRNKFDSTIVTSNFSRSADATMYWTEYDSEIVGGLFNDDSPATPSKNTTEFPMVPIDITHAMADDFTYAAPLNNSVDASKAHTYVCQWDATTSERRLTDSYVNTWKTNNADYYDIGGNNISVSNKIKYINSCTEFHGALSGCAHLAAACGKPVHVYLPGSASDLSYLNGYYRTSLRILRKYGATIHYTG